MAPTLRSDTDAVISLDEFIEYLDTQVDFDDLASIHAAAPQLRALANNRRFLAECVAAELPDHDNFQRGNNYYSRNLILWQQPRYTVRVSIWPAAGAADSSPRALDEDGRLVSLGTSIYGLFHNHAFSFLTVGYWGPGYATEIHECPTGDGVHAVGDPLPLTFLEHTTLPQGKVMYYRRFFDVHSQIPPAEFSISLNVLINSRENDFNDQYDVDPATGRVANVVGWDNDVRTAVCEMAGEIGDAQTAQLLQQLSARHPNRRVQAAAQQAARRIAERAQDAD